MLFCWRFIGGVDDDPVTRSEALPYFLEDFFEKKSFPVETAPFGSPL